MNVSFSVLGKEASPPKEEGTSLIFLCASPTIVQPSELKKIKTGLEVKVEPGLALYIVSHPNVAEKGVQVFSSPLVIDNLHEGELFIPLENKGRDPYNVMSNTVIAKAYLLETKTIKLEQVEPTTKPKKKPERSKPQKRNEDVKFEIR